MKIFLDTNIWRYIADTGAFNTLVETASSNGIELVVAPALVHEVRQLRDDTLRKKILSIIASPRLVRLMPEIYLEAEDIKYGDHITTVQGSVGVWYDYCGGYYFFTEEVELPY